MTNRFARAVVRHRWPIAAVWIVALGALAPAARLVERRLDVSARVEGSESAAVERIMTTRFRAPYAHYAVLVVTGVPSPATTAGAAALSEVLDAVKRQRGVAGTLSFLDRGDTTLLGAAGDGTFAIVGLENGDRPLDELVAPLRLAANDATRRLAPVYPRAAARWTGELFLNYDLRVASATDVAAAERRVLPVTLLLLLVAFGALGAALLPLAGGILAIVISLGCASLLARVWPLSILLENVVSMLGLGLGVDYALLTVSRFREALAAGASPDDAAADAAHHAGGTVALSGATVAVGFAALLIVPLGELRSVAVGGLLAVGASVLFATTLLPGLLAALGSRVDAGSLRRRSASSERGSALWRRWGRVVARRPCLVLSLGALPALALAAQAPRLRTSLPRGDWLPASMESARALRDLRRIGAGGIPYTLRVLVELPRPMLALERDGWNGAAAVDRHLRADRRVAAVQSIASLAGGAAYSPLLATMLPARVRQSFASTDQRIAVVDVVPRADLSIGEMSELVRDIRQADPATLTGISGAVVRVGGMPAFNLDYQMAIDRYFALVVAVVVVGTLAALAIGFRSVLVPLKAVALNLVSVGAAYGATALAFQSVRGARLLGLAAPLDGAFPALPVLVFCIVYGLSMDYEVFLVARVAEARRRGLDDDAALGEGLARTGGVITFAAAIMIVVFGAFTAGDFLMMKMLGFALAAAVLIDATIVRLALGPALLALAGHWNWWPGERVVVAVVELPDERLAIGD